MKVYIYILLITFFGFTSCINKSDNYTVKKIRKIKTIFSLENDSIIWGKQIPCMVFQDEYFYIADYQTTQLIVADKDLNLVKTIGEYGEGPEYFLGLSQFFIQDSDYYISDDRKKVIQLFSNDEYIKQIKFPKSVIPRSPTRFFVKDKIIYFPDYSDNSISCFDENSILKNKITFFPEENKQQPPLLLRTNSDYFIAVGTDVPRVGLYSFEGELISGYNLKDIPIIKSKIEHIKTLPSGSVYILFKDGYYSDDKLFLLFYDYIISFDLINREMELKNIYKLESLFYQKFCIQDNNLFAFEGASGGIDIYNIDNMMLH